MIIENARIDVKPGSEAAFEAAVAAALPLFRQSKGAQRPSAAGPPQSRQ